MKLLILHTYRIVSRAQVALFTFAIFITLTPACTILGVDRPTDPTEPKSNNRISHHPTTVPKVAPTMTLKEIAKAYGIPEVTNRFIEVPYDASGTINNRQVPWTNVNCQGGGGPTTKWSKTHNVEDQSFFFQDANAKPMQVVEIHFAQVHPGRRYSDSQCPGDEYRARVRIESVIPEVEPDLTGYVVEFRTGEGHLIASTNAHDGTGITLAHNSQPEDLYDRPALLLIFDTYTKGAQPTPTPRPEIKPEQKQVQFTLDSQKWESWHRGQQYEGTNCWTETTRTSPDLSHLNHQIADAKGQIWTIKSISLRERVRKCRGEDTTEYWISLVNNERAHARFTGYNLTIRSTNKDTKGGGHWDPAEDDSPVGKALIKGTSYGTPANQVTYRIWDAFEPNLPSPAPTATFRPTQTPIPTPTRRPTVTPTPTPVPGPIRQEVTFRHTGESHRYAIKQCGEWIWGMQGSNAGGIPYINVQIFPLTDGDVRWTFYDRYITEWLSEHAITAAHYERLTSGGRGDHIHVEYAWQPRETDCTYRVTEHFHQLLRCRKCSGDPHSLTETRKPAANREKKRQPIRAAPVIRFQVLG